MTVQPSQHFEVGLRQKTKRASEILEAVVVIVTCTGEPGPMPRLQVYCDSTETNFGDQYLKLTLQVRTHSISKFSTHLLWRLLFHPSIGPVGFTPSRKESWQAEVITEDYEKKSLATSVTDVCYITLATFINYGTRVPVLHAQEAFYSNGASVAVYSKLVMTGAWYKDLATARLKQYRLRWHEQHSPGLFFISEQRLAFAKLSHRVPGWSAQNAEASKEMQVHDAQAMNERQPKELGSLDRPNTRDTVVVTFEHRQGTSQLCPEAVAHNSICGSKEFEITKRENTKQEKSDREIEITLTTLLLFSTSAANGLTPAGTAIFNDILKYIQYLRFEKKQRYIHEWAMTMCALFYVRT
ncbi:hypothetical protein BDR07DRAFT_1456876 [Suillus spraguei]|nr:hypothetical protein BDR07DRAFT_1456876 [Suillus spraguei]